jgi:hypothetical protein
MDRLVDEVDVLYLVTALQAQFHPTHDDRLAGAVDLIEQLEETLPGEFREHLSDGIPDKAVAACDFHVSVVYVFVDMVGPGQHADETRHLAQELPLPGLPRRGAAAGQNPSSRRRWPSRRPGFRSRRAPASSRGSSRPARPCRYGRA